MTLIDNLKIVSEGLVSGGRAMHKATVLASVALLVLTGCGKSEPKTEVPAEIAETTPTQISAQQLENFKVQAELGAKCVGYFESSHSYAKEKGDSAGENGFNELSAGAINLGRADAAMASISSDEFDKMAFKYADKFDEIIDRSKKNEATDVDLAFVKQAKSECIKYMNAEKIEPHSSKEDIATLAPPKFTVGNYSNKDYSCSDSEGKKCVSRSQWKEMCDQASGITNYAGKIVFAPWAGDPSTSYLYDNGGFAGATFRWEDGKDARGENGRCVATLSISGTYEGSQVERSKDGAVREFLVNDGGEIIASRIDTYGY